MLIGDGEVLISEAVSSEDMNLKSIPLTSAAEPESCAHFPLLNWLTWMNDFVVKILLKSLWPHSVNGGTPTVLMTPAYGIRRSACYQHPQARNDTKRPLEARLQRCR